MDRVAVNAGALKRSQRFYAFGTENGSFYYDSCLFDDRCELFAPRSREYIRESPPLSVVVFGVYGVKNIFQFTRIRR
jgi:hypothetical protein